MHSERERHKREVEKHLRLRIGGGDWELSLPRGSGRETYVALSSTHKVFVKMGADIEKVRVMSEMGLTPQVLDVGRLEDGTTIMVQESVQGQHPGRVDYRERWKDVARVVREMHTNEGVKRLLPGAESERFREAGLQALHGVSARWDEIRGRVGRAARIVDYGLEKLEGYIEGFSGGGLAACHGDICWDNWVFADDGRIYVVDLDMMALDDPTLDIGPLLWWYYEPEIWGQFIREAGYEDGEELRERIWARLALHCLSILLPRVGSFDTFDPQGFAVRLRDFQAALARQGNPEL